MVFARPPALFSLPLAALELVVVALLGLYHRANLSKRRREVTKYIENITGTVDIAAKDTMVNSPLPMVIFRPESGDIIWTNDRFLKLTDDGEHLFDAKLSARDPRLYLIPAGCWRARMNVPATWPLLDAVF